MKNSGQTKSVVDVRKCFELIIVELKANDILITFLEESLFLLDIVTINPLALKSLIYMDGLHFRKTGQAMNLFALQISFQF